MKTIPIISNNNDYFRDCTALDRHSHEKERNMHKERGTASSIFNIKIFLTLFKTTYLKVHIFESMNYTVQNYALINLALQTKLH